jgi:hypothetical protein
VPAASSLWPAGKPPMCFRAWCAHAFLHSFCGPRPTRAAKQRVAAATNAWRAPR